VLDNLLVEAAARAGAEIRQTFSVDGLVIEDGMVRGIQGRSSRGAQIVERARVVVGADGVNSLVARSVKAAKYNEVPAAEAMYYAYWSGLPTDEFQIYARENRAIAAVPTHDGLTVALVAWPIEEFEVNKRDIEGNYLKSFQVEPTFAERIRGATRESKIMGTPMDGFYRHSYGPGWALVGDAGYHKDACTAQGISDAFLDAELLTNALDDAFSSRHSYEEALAAYQEARDSRTLPMFELTCQLASFEPPPPETQHLLAAIHGNQQASEDFMSVLAGTMAVQDFFDPTNVARYVDSASAGTSSTAEAQPQ
jgi:flavin-dependent dehydrogenase